MAVDTSTLGVKVTSEGIKETTAGLNKLAKAADKAEASVGKLEATASKVSAGVNSAASATANLTSQVTKQSSATASATAALNKLNQTAGGTNTSLKGATASANVFHGVLRNMSVAAGAYTGINLAKNIIESGDAWQSMQARLKIATGSMENARTVQQDLFELAQRLRVPLADSTRLYTRMADPMRELGKTSKETMNMVESVGLALQLSGATGAEASSVMLQFSQSVNAGRLNGAEFNAVAEGAPIILKALEIQTGKTRGELKKMGADGLISVELLSTALEKQREQWLKDFGELPVTFDGAMTRLKNSWLKAMGEMNESTSLNKGLVDTLKVFENMIPSIRDEMVGAFVAIGGWINRNKEGISETWSQVKGLVKDVWELAGAIGSISGQILGVANDFSVFGFAVFSVRLIIAGIQDGITVLGALILKLGSYIYKAVVLPFTLTARMVQTVQEKFANLLGVFSDGAAAVGLDSISEKLRGASQGVTDISKTLGGMADSVDFVGDALSATADGMLGKIADSEGAVGRLLNGTEEAKKAADNLNKTTYKESPDLAVNAARTAAAAAKVANAKAEREAVKAAKKAATEQINDIKRYNQELDNSNDKITEQRELMARLQSHGLDYDKLTEGEKKVIKLTADLNVENREAVKLSIQKALAVASEQAALEKLNAAQIKSLQNARDLKIAQDTANADMANVDKQYSREIAGYSLGDKAKADMEKIAAIEDKFQEQRRELDKRNSESKIDNYDQQLAVITRNQQFEMDRYKQHTEEKKKLDANWLTGATAAWNDYQEKANDVAGQSKEAFANAFQGLEDALVSFVTTGKLSFSDLAKSIMVDIAKMAAKAAASGLFNLLLNMGVSYATGGASGGAAGGSAGTGYGGSTSGATQMAANGAVFSAGQSIQKFANGGAFGKGIVDTPTNFDIGQMGEAGPEAIVPLTKTADGSLGIRQVGSSESGGNTVTIYQEFNIADGGTTGSTTGDDDKYAKEFAEQMKTVANNQIQKATQQGGAIWKMKNAR